MFGGDGLTEGAGWSLYHEGGGRRPESYPQCRG